MSDKKYTLAQLRGAWAAGKKSGEAVDDPSNHYLVGRYFRSYVRGQMNWQGKIVREVDQNTFVAQLFSWVDGFPTNEVIVKLNEMEDWQFYRTIEDMNRASAKFVRHL